MQAKLPEWKFDSEDLKKIRLHRIWTYEDASGVKVRKIPKYNIWNRFSSHACSPCVYLNPSEDMYIPR